MDQERVWTMPVRRFWSMERNIARIMAENDIRHIQVNQAQNSQDNYDTIIKRLTKEIGDTAKLKYNKIVKPEPEAKDKLQLLMG